MPLFCFNPRIRHQLGAAEKGAMMDGLNMTVIKELSLPLPPMSLQRRFANFAKQRQQFRANYLEAVRQADHFFHTIR